MSEFLRTLENMTDQYLDGAITEAELVNAVAALAVKATDTDWYRNSPVPE